MINLLLLPYQDERCLEERMFIARLTQIGAGKAKGFQLVLALSQMREELLGQQIGRVFMNTPQVSITIQKFPPVNIQFFPVAGANQGF